MAIPVNIGLIDLSREKFLLARFRGVTADISKEGLGLGLELSYPASGMFPFETRMIGENREFDLELIVELETKGVSCVDEVSWISTHSSSGLKMGVFMKEMKDDEKEKWTDFVISQSKGWYYQPR